MSQQPNAETRPDGRRPFYTLAEVAEMYSLSLITLTRRCRAGKVWHVHSGRTRGMTPEQIDVYIAGLSVGVASPPVKPEVDDVEQARAESRLASRGSRKGVAA